MTVIVLASVGLLALFGWLVIPAAVRQTQALASHAPTPWIGCSIATGFLGTLEQRFDLGQRLRETTTQLPAFALRKVPGVTASASSVVFKVLTVAVLTVYFLVGLPRGGRRLGVAGRPAHPWRPQRPDLGGVAGPDRRLRLRQPPRLGHRGDVGVRGAGTPGCAVRGGAGILGGDRRPRPQRRGNARRGPVRARGAVLLRPHAAAIVAVYFVVYQRVENYFILPRIMTKAIDLSAPTVIVALLIGASLAGLEGALIALPIAAAVKVAIREVWLAGRTTS